MKRLMKWLYEIAFFSIVFYLVSDDFSAFDEPLRTMGMVLFAVVARGLDYSLSLYLSHRFGG
jgi:hypothetical protein